MGMRIVFGPSGGSGAWGEGPVAVCGHVSMSGLEDKWASINFCSFFMLGTSVLVCHTSTCMKGWLEGGGGGGGGIITHAYIRGVVFASTITSLQEAAEGHYLKPVQRLK